MVVRTMSCTCHIIRAMIRVATGGENHSETKGVRGTRTTAALSACCKDRNAGLMLLPLTSQCYDTMANVMVVRTISCDTLYLLHNKRMIRDRYVRSRKRQRSRYHLASQHSSKDSSSSVHAT